MIVEGGYLHCEMSVSNDPLYTLPQPLHKTPSFSAYFSSSFILETNLTECFPVPQGLIFNQKFCSKCINLVNVQCLNQKKKWPNNLIQEASFATGRKSVQLSPKYGADPFYKPANSYKNESWARLPSPPGHNQNMICPIFLCVLVFGALGENHLSILLYKAMGRCKYWICNIIQELGSVQFLHDIIFYLESDSMLCPFYQVLVSCE